GRDGRAAPLVGPALGRPPHLRRHRHGWRRGRVLRPHLASSGSPFSGYGPVIPFEQSRAPGMVRATPTLPHFVGDLQPGSVQNGQGVISIDTALYLADYLAHSGVQRIYAVPDPEVVALLNAFRLRGVESIA